MPWISNYVHNKLYDVITDPYHDFNGVVVKQVWIRDCIPYKTMDVFTYPCLNLSFCFLTRRVHTPKTILITHPHLQTTWFITLGRRHDVAIRRKHFPCCWPFVRGIHRSPVDSPHKDQWREALMSSLICVWTNDWANNRDRDNFRRHQAHYDLTVRAHINSK